MGYKFIDHTADVGVDLRTETLDALFVEALMAFTETLTDPSAVGRSEKRRWRVSARDLETLMVDWLGEALYAFEIEGFLAAGCGPEVREIEKEGAEGEGTWTLSARVEGDLYDPERHPIKVLIKAITFHQLGIERCDGGWAGRVIFDI